MTTDAILAVLLNVLLPAILAILGGVLAVRSLTNAKQIERWSWVFAFIFFGLAGVLLGVVQQIRLTTQQKLADSQVADERLRASNEVRYTQGELDAIKNLLQVFAQNTDPAKQAQLFRSLAGSFKVQAPPPAAAPSTPTVTNSQLADSAKDIARRFRELQDYYSWHENNERQVHANGINGPIPQSYYSANISRLQPIRTEAMALRRVILDRLPPQPKNNDVEGVLDDDSLAGANPLYGVADYFEGLAHQLSLK